MAVLTVDSLTGCNSIPDFIPSGTRTVFYNTAAPSSWTKDTSSHNDKALRVTNGTISSGGSSPFLTVFPDTNRSVQGSVNTNPDIGVTVNQKNITQDNAVATGAINAISQSSITIQNRTLQVTQIVAHTHTYSRRPNTSDYGLGITKQPQNTLRVDDEVVTASFNNSTGPTSHTHSINPADRQQHTHPITVTQHTHGIGNGPHNHSITPGISQDFSISYVDVIIAQKN